MYVFRFYINYFILIILFTWCFRIKFEYRNVSTSSVQFDVNVIPNEPREYGNKLMRRKGRALKRNDHLKADDVVGWALLYTAAFVITFKAAPGEKWLNLKCHCSSFVSACIVLPLCLVSVFLDCSVCNILEFIYFFFFINAFGFIKDIFLDSA